MASRHSPRAYERFDPIFSPSPARRRQQRPTGKTARKRTHAYVRTDPFGTTATALITCICLLAGSFLACSGRDHDEVLVITNSESPASVAIGEYYAAKRGVPSENIVKLKIPLWDAKLPDRSPETVGPEHYDEWIRQPLEAFIDERGLRDSIQILVTTKGIPLRIDGETSAIDTWLRDTSQASVDAELSLLFSDRAGSAGIPNDVNPYFNARMSFSKFRKNHPDARLRYMVARLTGYATETDQDTQVPVDIKRLIDSGADEDVEEATPQVWLIDEDPSHPPGLDAVNRMWLAPTAKVLAGMGARVEHNVEDEFASGVNNLAGYASWGSNDRHDAGKPYYGEIGSKNYPGTFAKRSIAFDLVSTSARTFAFPPQYGQSLVADLLRLGVSGAAGHVYEPVLPGVVRPHILLPTYAEGVIAVEAYYRSLPFLGWTNVYIGDPLMTVPTPLERAGDDRDFDGVPDASDNCTEVANPDQRDTNSDGFGNLCDADVDGDGLVTTSWGAIYPLTKRGDVEWIAIAAQNGPYDENFDLDGDGEIDARDVAISHLNLFLPPGPSARATRRD